MSHDDGASTDVTGTFVSSRARITAGNGSRTSPEKLKPYKMVSVRPCRHNIAQTKDSIDDMIIGSQRFGEIVDKRDVEIFELFGKALDQTLTAYTKTEWKLYTSTISLH